MATQAEAWTTVGKGGRSKRSKNIQGCSPQQNSTNLISPSYNNSSPTRKVTEAQITRQCSLITAASTDIRTSKFYAGLLHLLQLSKADKAQKLVIYGLGSLEQPGAVHIRYQLALATLLEQSVLPDLNRPAEAFDPAFTALDKQVLLRCSIEVTSINEQGRHIAHIPTFFFMPHCEAYLTDNLLSANITAGTLDNVFILGNSFSEYEERWSDGGLGGAPQGRQPPVTLLKLCALRAVVEYRVDELGFPVASAFNDLGLHCFRGDWKERLQSAA